MGFLIISIFLLANVRNQLWAVNNPLHFNKEEVSYSQLMEDNRAFILSIDNQLAGIERILDDNALTYRQFVKRYPEEVRETSLRNSEVRLILQADQPPLDVSGFVWGFCLGIVGVLVVSIAMEKGPDRKKHLRNAIFGCILGGLAVLLFYYLVITIVGGCVNTSCALGVDVGFVFLEGLGFILGN